MGLVGRRRDRVVVSERLSLRSGREAEVDRSLVEPPLRVRRDELELLEDVVLSGRVLLVVVRLVSVTLIRSSVALSPIGS